MSFKRVLSIIAFTLSLSLPLCAQYTTVTATITDPNSTPYANGHVSAAITARSPFAGTAIFPPSTAATALDTTGSFTLALADNNQLVNTASQWTFTICAVDNKTCFTSTQTVTGTSQSFTTTFSALAPLFYNLGQPTGMPMEVFKLLTPTTQSGSITATTMFTPTVNTMFRFNVHLDQIGIGNTCTTNTTIVSSVTWTDPVSSSPTTATVVTFTITTNGAANVPVLPPSAGVEVFSAKAGTPVQYSTTYTAGSCVTAPTYQLKPTLEQL